MQNYEYKMIHQKVFNFKNFIQNFKIYNSIPLNTLKIIALNDTFDSIELMSFSCYHMMIHDYEKYLFIINFHLQHHHEDIIYVLLNQLFHFIDLV